MPLWYLQKVTDQGLKQSVLSLQENYCLTKLVVGGTGGEIKLAQDEEEVVNQRRQRGIMETNSSMSC